MAAAAGRLPPGAALFDFSALAVRGAKCWIAGSPGSRVFFTPDAGRSWSAYPTGTSLPLKAIAFVDDLHGWAVGELGQILASDDGGQTWRRQRSGGARAAVMAVAGLSQDLPLELLARICKEQGYLGVAEVLGRTDVETQSAGRRGPGRPAAPGHVAGRRECRRNSLGISHPPARLAAFRTGYRRSLESSPRRPRRRRPDGPCRAADSHLAAECDSRFLDGDSDGLYEIVERTAVAAVKLAADPATWRVNSARPAADRGTSNGFFW